MKVFVECYNDYALARTLSVEKEDIRHGGGHGGIGKVVGKLMREAGNAIGIVDGDPGKSQPRSLADFDRCGESTAHGLRLARHRGDPDKSLIVIDPRLEEWLLARAAACGLSPADYGLPATGPDLHRQPRRDHDPDFRRFLADLAARDDGMKTLAGWLTPPPASAPPPPAP